MIGLRRPGPQVTTAPRTRITARSVLLGLVLTFLSILWVHQLEIVWYNAEPTTIALYFHVIFIILALLVLNILLRRVRPSWALQPSELLVIYVMLAIGNSLAGHDQLEILVPMLAHSTWFASAGNRWQTLFDQYLPDWLVVKDRAALQGFHEGGVSLFTRANLLAWGTPIAVWTGFIVVLVVTTLCLNVIFRKQWTERERLAYPIAQVPLEITEPRYDLWRSRLFWGAFTLALLIDTCNAFSTLFPALPAIPTRSHHIEIADWPWSATGGFTIAFYPFAIGLGYLLPLDLLFSSWLFYWFWKLQYLLTAVLGFGDRPNFPYVLEQSCGAYLGLSIFVIYLARRHLVAVARKSLGLPSPLDDREEPAPYRLAALGVVAGSGLLIAAGLAMGVPLWAVLLFFLMYFGLATAVTRIRAEFGPPAHDLHYGGPDTMLPAIFGSSAFGPQALTAFSLTWWMNRAFRSLPMPHEIEGFYIGTRRGMNNRGLLRVMIVTVVAAVLISFGSLLFAGYHYGWSAKLGYAAQVFGREPFERLAGWLTMPTQPSPGSAIALGIGIAFSLAMLFLRSSFVGWPLHPVGYAVSSSWSMKLLWMPMLIAWVIKLLVLRYGGLRLYRQGLPLFLGLILGEYVAGGLWSLIGIALHTGVWVFWP